MATTIGNLAVIISANAGQLYSTLSSATRAITSFAAGAMAATGNVTGFLSAFAASSGMGGFNSFSGALGAMAATGVQAYAAAEQAELAFTVMLGSAMEAKVLMADLEKFSAETPFQLPEINQAAKQLVAFGVAGRDVLSTMTMLGDLASAVNVPMTEMADLFGRNKVQVNMMTKDIREFLNKGIDILTPLAKMKGVKTSDIMGEGGLASQGQIKFTDIEQALKMLTGEGGRFGGLMAKQAQTLGGLWSTFIDNVRIGLKDIAGLFIEGFDFKGILQNAIIWVKQFAAFVRPVIMSLVGAMQGFGAMLSEMFPNTAGNVSGFFVWIRDALTLMFVAMEFGFRQWKPMLDLSWAYVALFWERTKGITVWYFTDLYPALLVYMVELWSKYFEVVYGMLIQFWTNIAQNAAKVGKTIMINMMTGRFEMPEFIGLYDGLKDKAKNIFNEVKFDMPGRKTSDMEKTLSDEIDIMAKNLGEKWNQFKDTKFNLFEMTGKAKGLGLAGMRLAMHFKDMFMPAWNGIFGDAANVAGETIGNVKLPDALEEGSKQAIAVINDFTSKAEDPAKQGVEEQKKGNVLLDAGNKLLEGILEKLGGKPKPAPAI